MTDAAVAITNGNPLIDYANRRLWGNPENDKQFQVKIRKISSGIGEINWFGYMGRMRPTPQTKKKYHIFTAGGTHPGFWNFADYFKTRNPINKWINASVMAKRRGVQIDFYDTLGRQYPRTKTWIMSTQDGLVLIAFEDQSYFDLNATTGMFFRCYSTDLMITKSTDAMADNGNPYVYESVTYEGKLEYSNFLGRYSTVKSRDGYTGVFWNGIFQKSIPDASKLTTGDVVEFWHDPTVSRVIYYDYATALDYYSTLDANRKLILHPPKDGDFTFRYFDDNDYYIVNSKGTGVYFHRNAENAIRQLTHADVGISVEQIKVQMTAISDFDNDKSIQIMVLERNTDWNTEFPWEAQRIRYLYALGDSGIISAMTGANSTVKEWTADYLESGPTMSYIRQKFSDISIEKINQALGYNAETLVVSKTPMLVNITADNPVVNIPPTFAGNCTIWEYDSEGLLLGYYGLVDETTFVPKYSGCAKVEYTYGQPGRNINYQIVSDDVVLDGNPELRVYISPFNIDTQTITGALTDVTGTNYYHYEGNRLIWNKLDKVNYRGVLVDDTVFLCHEFTLDHIDHSLCFSLDDLYAQVIGNLPINFANIDVWINKHPLIDNVDWVFGDRKIFINSRQWLVEGPQNIVVRCTGQWEDATKPKFETELGFVAGGAIGVNKRYNLRQDRNTRIVIGGKLMLLEEIKTAETDLVNDYNNVLNGLPYMVKHTYTPVKFAKDFDKHYLYAEARTTDESVSNYLTKNIVKNQSTVDFNMGDKYQMYSCFMNVIVNAIANGILTIPTLGNNSSFIDKDVRDLCSIYEWWLPYDPIIRKYDARYFDFIPYANIGKIVVTNDEFTFLKQVNHLYLNNTLSIEGYFEVAHNVSV